MVSMDVGIDDMGDSHIPGLSLLNEPIFITGHHIHSHGLAFATAAK
jgi:hypothetical protein